MTDRDTTTRKAKKRIQVERLELNKESVESLTEEQAEAARKQRFLLSHSGWIVAERNSCRRRIRNAF